MARAGANRGIHARTPFSRSYVHTFIRSHAPHPVDSPFPRPTGIRVPLPCAWAVCMADHPPLLRKARATNGASLYQPLDVLPLNPAIEPNQPVTFAPV